MGLIQEERRFRKWLRDVVFWKDKSGIVAKVPLLPRIRYHLLGFTAAEYVKYDLAHNDHRDYISMRERWRLEPLNGKYARMLGRKLQFERAFSPYVRVPHVYCWISRGRLIDMDAPERDLDLCSVLRREGGLIAKPTQSAGGGKGVFALSFRGERFYLDGEAVPEEKLTEHLLKLDDYMLVQAVKPHAYAREVFGGSLNTIRVVTGMSMDRRRVEVLFAFHRFGCTQSAPTDNISRGGLFAMVDTETGVCGAAASLLHLGRSYGAHPETNARIAGLHIPEWTRILKTVCDRHRRHPFYELLAWDVALSEEGEIYAIEVNRASDLSCQIVRPLRHEKLGAFMREHNLLDKR